MGKKMAGTRPALWSINEILALEMEAELPRVQRLPRVHCGLLGQLPLPPKRIPYQTVWWKTFYGEIKQSKVGREWRRERGCISRSWREVSLTLDRSPKGVRQWGMDIRPKNPFQRKNSMSRREGGGRGQTSGNWVLSNIIVIDKEHSGDRNSDCSSPEPWLISSTYIAA